jgi:tetratricopeptide (TPR) repeat protein
MHYTVGLKLLSIACLSTLVLSAQNEFGERVRIAGGLFQARDYVAAEKLYLEALQETADSGQTSIRTAVIMNNLGSVCHQLNKLLAAERWYRRAAEMYEEVADPGHPLRVRCTSNLAEFYLETGQTARAATLKPLLLKHLEASSLSSPGIGNLLTTLAGIAAMESRFGEAEGFYSRALASRDALEPDGALMMQIMNNLGALKEKAGRRADALALFEKASGTCAAKCAPGSPFAAAVLFNIATARLWLNGPQDADPAFATALAYAEVALGGEDVLVGKILANYSAVLRKLKKKALAKEYERRARAILSSASARNPWRHSTDFHDFAGK